MLTTTAILSLAALSAAAIAAPRPAAPKYCNLIFAQTDMSLVGLRRFIDGARSRGTYGRFRMTILLHPDAASANLPGHREFYQSLAAEGHEIGVFFSQGRPAIARWLGIPESKITTLGFELFGDVDVEEQARATEAGFRAGVNACVEGDSMREELWDIPHNWEGAPYLPYYVQWDSARPQSTARVNRAQSPGKAMLEIQWATRTMWHNYDRICLPQCFHFGEPLKHTQWPFEQMCRRGTIRWWRAEIDELEANLKAGRTPLLYLNTASEANVFAPEGPWKPFLDSDEARDCALDLVGLLLQRNWRLVTVAEFTDAFTRRWPCPQAPSAAFLMRDTLAGFRDKQGLVVPSHGRLLHAETQHFQVIDHENRMAPEMVTAYDLQTPNLLRGGYTFADPAEHGAGQNRGQYAATTGNALFWSPSDMLANAKGEPYYHSAKPADARDRTFTLYVGDQWQPYQFAPARISRVARNGEVVTWRKETRQPVTGTDTAVRYTHTLAGPEHRVRVELLGAQAVGKPVRLRLCPYCHQGWDVDHSKPGSTRAPGVPDPTTVGQERNVFAQVDGKEFAFSESNPTRRTEVVNLGGKRAAVRLFNRNPGRDPGLPGWTIDDNRDMNRGLTLTLPVGARSVRFIDEPGPGHYVTAIVEFGPHRVGRVYEFSFRYWKGEPPAAP